MMKKRWISLIIPLVFILASCASSQSTQQADETTSSEPVTANTEKVSSPSQEDTANETPVPLAESALRDLTEKAKQDLASQFNYGMDQIKVATAKTVTWQDTSLGCPQQDMQYAQVLIPGFWILLEADSKQYPYHTDQESQVVLCLNDLSINAEGTPLPFIPVKPDDIKDGDPWVPVD